MISPSVAMKVLAQARSLATCTHHSLSSRTQRTWPHDIRRVPRTARAASQFDKAMNESLAGSVQSSSSIKVRKWWHSGRWSAVAT
jgi:hypothetical protein